MERLRRNILPGRKAEVIASMGCIFTVYRHSNNSRVVSVALWKSSVGYITSLSISLLWWHRNFHRLFPGYNLRMFIEPAIFRKFSPEDVERDDPLLYEDKFLDWKERPVKMMINDVKNARNDRIRNIRLRKIYRRLQMDQEEEKPFDLQEKINRINARERKQRREKFIHQVVPEIEKYNIKNDIDWMAVIQRLSTNPHIELWFYDCGWGRSSNSSRHMGTFGSLVRYQPLFDPSVEITVVRNIEMLSSAMDARIVKKWEKSGKKAHLYTLSQGYICDDKRQYFPVCSKAGLSGRTMTLSTFSFRGTLSRKFIPVMKMVAERDQNRFSYGIDEVFLTRVFITGVIEGKPPILNSGNTNITFITPFYTYFEFLEDKNYIHRFISQIDRYRKSCPLVDNPLNEYKKVIEANRNRNKDTQYIISLYCREFEKDVLQFINELTLRIPNNKLQKAKEWIQKEVSSMFFSPDIGWKLSEFFHQVLKGDDEILILALFSFTVPRRTAFPGLGSKTKNFVRIVKKYNLLPYMAQEMKWLLTTDPLSND